MERELREGTLDLLYVAPERLLTPRFMSLLDASRVALFAIDEAHASRSGHDFRREYRELTVLHERWPHVQRIALTATTDPPTLRAGPFEPLKCDVTKLNGDARTLSTVNPTSASAEQEAAS